MLQKFPWAPRLFSWNVTTLVTSYVGEPLRPESLPSNYQAQYSTILNDMKSVRVSHNDIFRPGHKLELHVKDGRLSVVDFGWATVNGSYATCPGVSPVAPPKFVRASDDGVMELLRNWETLASRLHALDQAQAGYRGGGEQ